MKNVESPVIPLKSKVAALPGRSGVYIFRGAGGEVLYVGKAKDLRKRVASYLKPRGLEPRIRRMTALAHDLDYVVVESDLEALMLEWNLIQEHRPPFNILFRDDKSYPYIIITMADRYPYLAVARRPRVPGAKLYGPYPAGAIRKTVDLLRSVFPICTCRTPEKGRGGRCPCLDYHIKRCVAPCLGNVDAAEYRQLIKGVDLFLEGKRGRILQVLDRRMKEAAGRLDYERAARIRDRMQAVRTIIQGQKVVSPGIPDADVLGSAGSPAAAVVQVLSVREHKLVGSWHFSFPPATDRRELIRSFLMQYYLAGSSPPAEVYLPDTIEDRGALEEWLTARRGRRARLVVPRRGEKRALVAMAEENAGYSLQKEELRAARSLRQAEGLVRLQEELGLPGLPQRIEGYDISTTSGREAVGSMVVLVEGQAYPQGYRRFRIRKHPGLDDVGMMREMLERRFSRLAPRKAEPSAGTGAEASLPRVTVEGDAGFGAPPDLVLVDGGMAQANLAREALSRAGLDIPVVGLAKRLEEIYRPGEPEPVRLPAASPALHLLQRLRDEAHRFALDYHRNLRGKKMLASLLEEVPGVGPKRRKRLLDAFGSVEEVATAGPEEVRKVAGLSHEVARELVKHVQAARKYPTK